MKNVSVMQWLLRRILQLKSDAPHTSRQFFPEQIHRFRVEAKKLRAVLRFLADEPEYRLPKPFRKLYTQAGAIRDCQVQLQAISMDKQHSLPGFVIWLAYGMADAGKAWKAKKVDTGIDALQQITSEFAEGRVEEVRLWQYFEVYTSWLREFAGGNMSDERLHEIRKHTKDMLYIFSFCREVLPDAQEERSIAEHQLQRLAEIAGAYNDKTNLLRTAARYQEDGCSFSDKEEARAVPHALKSWTAQQAALKQELLQAVSDMIHTHPPQHLSVGAV
jgi:CHAD domain-containing protein